MVATKQASKGSKKLIPLVGGHLDGLSVSESDIVDGIFSAKISGKMHDFGNGERELVWMISKNSFCDMTVFYKLDGQALYYFNREPS